MEKHFVTYPQALALKEIGFDEPCMGKYDTKQGDEWFLNIYSGHLNAQFSDKNKACIAPLKSQVFEFFREKHHLTSWIQSLFNKDSNGYFTFKIRNDDGTYIYTDAYFENYMGNGFNGYHKSYEETESACIDKLIEIIKLK